MTAADTFTASTPTTPRTKRSNTMGTTYSAPPSPPRPELPSLPIANTHWAKGATAGQPESPRTPIEMPGSTFIHEHHPMFQSREQPAAAGSELPVEVSVTSPGGTSETETYRPPFASVERISETFKRPA
jgi:hypothetical protein